MARVSNLASGGVSTLRDRVYGTVLSRENPRSDDTRDVHDCIGIISVTKQFARGNDATTLGGIGRW